jgi:cytochrome P450 family 6
LSTEKSVHINPFGCVSADLRENRTANMEFIFEKLFLYVGALAACVLAVVYAYFKVSFTYWKKKNVPYVEPYFPFGNFADALCLRKSIGSIFEDIYKKLEGQKYGGIYACTKPIFVFRDPDIIKNILVKDFISFQDRGFFNDEEIEPLTGNLFSLEGSRWRNLRVKLTPTFTSGKMKMMFQTIIDCGQELGSILEKCANNEEVIEVKDILARYSTDVIASSAFGIQCNCLKNPDAEFRQWGRKLFGPSVRNVITTLLNSLFPKVLSVLRLGPIEPKVSKYFRNMVEETVKYRERNNVTRNDFLQLLIQIKNKVNLNDENENLEMNDYGKLENKTSESGMHS